jgi:hypothetical protein
LLFGADTVTVSSVARKNSDKDFKIRDVFDMYQT